MQRTWEFSATPRQSPQLSVNAKVAHVSQKSVHLHLEVTNQGENTVVVSADRFSLELADGSSIRGRVRMLDRATKLAKRTLASIGMDMGEVNPGLPPGDSMLIQISFRSHERDLRRHPAMRVNLDALMVEGKPSGLAPMLLHAPPEAPVGEDI